MELNDVQAVDEKSAERLRFARRNLKNREGVDIPKILKENIEKDDCLVVLVSFSGHNEDQPTHHPAPDPLLLLLKAANVNGRLTGMQYLTNGVISTVDCEADIAEYASLLGIIR